MAGSSMSHQISHLCSQINNRRFGDDALRLLVSVLVSKDVKSLIEVRSSIKEFLRSESLPVLREIATKAVDHQLSVLDFFVRAFAIIGDFQSCLALRYEALLLREHKSQSYQWLQVSHQEWLDFAEHSLDNGFYSIATKACDNALLSLQIEDVAEPITEVTERINKLKNSVLASTASHTVQAQAAEYLKKKRNEKSKTQFQVCRRVQGSASTLFRTGIRKRNDRQLHAYQRLHQINSGTSSLPI